MSLTDETQILTVPGTYYRWSRLTPPGGRSVLRADILGSDVTITAEPATGLVRVTVPERQMDPDTARMIGVRLIEAAAIADNGRSVRGR